MKNKFWKNQTLILTLIGLIGLAGIGVSYSYYLANFNVSNKENDTSNVTTQTLTQVVMDMQGKVESKGTYPGHKMAKEVVVRGIGNESSLPTSASIVITPDLGVFTGDVIWKLYKSETPINCSNTEKKYGGTYFEEGTCMIPTGASLELEGDSDTASMNITVYPNTETNYYLVIEYLNKANQNAQLDSSFSIEIGIDVKKKTVADDIIATLDTTGKCPSINADGTVSVTASEETDGYLCSAKDNYGTSYYYRGNVTNNYVKFAGYYWRIVRINGDNSIRLIYDGTTIHENGDVSSDRQVGTSIYNKTWKDTSDIHVTVWDDNASGGYMYGKRAGITNSNEVASSEIYNNDKKYKIASDYYFDLTNNYFVLKNPVDVAGSELINYTGYYLFNEKDGDTYTAGYFMNQIFSATLTDSGVKVDKIYYKYGTTSKENAQENIYNSDIKIYLDNWYEKNIKDTTYEKYLTDNIFCNDRTTDDEGYGAKASNYRTRKFYEFTKNSQLFCQNKNDSFTVDNLEYGNGSLIYPIGLLTADETINAGIYDNEITNNYLYTGNSYWTMSYSMYNENVSYVRAIYTDGSSTNYGVGSDIGVKPVINIRAEAITGGNGQMDNPYTVGE